MRKIVFVVMLFAALVMQACDKDGDVPSPNSNGKTAAPVASPPAGSVGLNTQVLITTATEGAVVWYTTDLTDPSTSITRKAVPNPITIVEDNTRIMAVAVKDGLENSDVVSLVYNIDKLRTATPVANPEAGEVGVGTNIELTSATEGAVIYYTIDGSTPDTTDANTYVYSNLIRISADTTIKAIAVKSGFEKSDILTAGYTIIAGPPKLSKPVAAPAGGSYLLREDTITVTLTQPEDAVIHYTTDGSIPTESSPVYSGGFVIDKTCAVKAIAVKEGWVTSNAVTEEYFFDLIKMVAITGGVVSEAPPVSAGGGIFKNCGNGVTMTLSNFQIAESETPYSVWYEVRKWAEVNGYKFYDPVLCMEFQGYGSPALYYPYEPTDKEPVSLYYGQTYWWKEVVVWCNAYSEYCGRTPAYVASEGGIISRNAAVLKDVTQSIVATAVVKPGATGYRMPTEVQWEYAARGGNPQAPEWNYFWAGTNNESELSQYAVYLESHTLDVKSKKPNSAGLYDMSGNMYEACYDWYDAPPTTSQINYTGPKSNSNKIHVVKSTLCNYLDPSVDYRVGNKIGTAIIIGGIRVVCP